MIHSVKKIITIALIVICGYFILKTLVQQPLTADSYLHIASGKHIVEQRKIPEHSTFSYKHVSPANEYISHSWLGDSIFYLIFQSGISYAPSAFLALLLAGAIFGVYKICRLVGLTNTTFIPISIFFSIILIQFWRLHPLVYASTLMIWILYIYMRWLYGVKTHFLIMPLLFLLYAQLAGGYIAIPILVLISVLIFQLIFQRLLTKKLRSPYKSIYKILTASTLASILITVLNPLTLLIHSYTFAILSILLSRGKLFSGLTGTLKVLNQNFIKETPSTLFYLLFLVYIASIVGLYVFFSVRRRTSFLMYVFPILPLLFAIYLPFLWIRFIPVTSVILAPAFILLVAFIKNEVIKPTKFRSIMFLFQIMLLILIEALLMFPPIFEQIKKPDAQIELLRELDLPINIMTSPNLTGYALLKSGRRMYIDAQDDLYDENENIHFFIFEPQLSAEELENLVLTNNVSTLLVDKEFGQLPTFLSNNPEWGLLYFDYSGFLYSSSALATGRNTQEHILKTIDFSKNLGFDDKQSTASAQELEQFVTKYPQNIMAKGQLASIYRFQHNFKGAETLLTSIPLENLNYIVYTELGRLKAAQGNCQDAEIYFLKALEDRQETNFARATLDLAVLYAICLNDKNQAKKYYQRFNSFPLPPEERGRIRQMMLGFGIQLDQ